MAEKPEEEFDEEESEDGASSGEDLDLDKLKRDLDPRKRRGHKPVGDPAWRKLERFLEDKRTHDLLVDFDEYEVDLGEPSGGGDAMRAGRETDPPRRKPAPKRRSRR